MSTYAISQFGFIRWEGPPPSLVREHVTEFSKIGTNGISAQLLGIHGDPFEVQLTAWFANEVLCRASQYGYRGIIGTTSNLIYENTLYTTFYSHKYLVHAVDMVQAKRRPRLLGPSIDYIGGWELISRWTLIPWSLSTQ